MSTTPWWLARPHRLLQTNLREIDADLDVDRFVADARDLGADAVLFNVGGIVANYPTEHPYHYRNPHDRGDLAGSVLAALHAAGLRMIARFDFSKCNEAVAAAHPDWSFRTADGDTVTYNGQRHMCLNGAYQQEHLFAILAEAVERYDFDAIFFNMSGYISHDYHRRQYGICHCANCVRRFRDEDGRELPRSSGPADPNWPVYRAFQRRTADEQFVRIRDHIRALAPDTAICTGRITGVDIVRSESNTGLLRPLPQWLYTSSDNIKTVQNTPGERASSNSSVHFIDYAYRHSAVPPALNRLRLGGDLIHGAWLDYYCIGTIAGLDDRRHLADVRRYFAWHRDWQDLFAGSTSAAAVAIVKPVASTALGAERDYRGLFRMLAGSGIPFDVIQEGHEPKRGYAAYRLIVVPDCPLLPDAQAAALDEWVAAGGHLLASGATACLAEDGTPVAAPRLRSLGIERILARHAAEPGSYWRIRDHDREQLAATSSLQQCDLLPGDLPWIEAAPAADTMPLLGWIEAGTFGPPEKCFYTSETDRPGLFCASHGTGRSAWIPWPIGHWIEPHGQSVVGLLFQALLDGPLAVALPLRVEAHPCVEVTHYRAADGRHWIGLLNHSGQVGNTVHDALPIHDVRCRIRACVTEARSALGGSTVRIERDGDDSIVILDRLDEVDLIVS